MRAHSQESNFEFQTSNRGWFVRLEGPVRELNSSAFLPLLAPSQLGCPQERRLRHGSIPKAAGKTWCQYLRSCLDAVTAANASGKGECRKTHAFNVLAFGSANASWRVGGPAGAPSMPAGSRALLRAPARGTTDLGRSWCRGAHRPRLDVSPRGKRDT
jgi:hypothetical protein